MNLLTGLLLAASLWATDGWKDVALRGSQQHVLHLPGKHTHHTAILFLPGDGGWRGAAKDMAAAIATSGYDVFVWDTKHYLTSFTALQGQLHENEIGPDFAAMRRTLVPNAHQPVVLVGWSQGAAMSAVAAASPEGKAAYAGAILLALPDAGVLAWRWKDNLTYLTGKLPNEPAFSTENYLGQMSPLPAAVIQAGKDRFTAKQVSQRLISRMHRPRRVRTLEDAEHDFGPNRSAMYHELNAALLWITRRNSRS
jgi:dienelactone hydrolase